jgi:hypothetical protein
MLEAAQMRGRFAIPGAAVVLFSLLSSAQAPAGEPAVSPDRVRQAAAKALPLIEKSTAEYPHQRDCFSCHHQAVPVLALTLSRTRGFWVDDANIQEQVELARTDLESARESYRQGRGQGGGATRAGYALWTIANGGGKADETTAAVIEFLLKRDGERGEWRVSSNRPPSEASPFTATFVALQGLRSLGASDKREQIDKRVSQALQWLLNATAGDTEERVFRLWALKIAGAPESAVRDASAELLRTQQDDGGWAQLSDRSSDAYATGTALVALHEAAGLDTNDPAYQRGLAFLIKTQLDDGSWHVVSRSHPFQTYFESGFPHGKDQFISIAASSWATAALVLACPKE